MPNTTLDLSKVDPASLDFVNAVIAFAQGKPVQYLKSNGVWTTVRRPKFKMDREYHAAPVNDAEDSDPA